MRNPVSPTVRRLTASALLSVSALLLPAGGARAAPGDLDRSFGDRGRSFLPRAATLGPSDLLALPGGKVVVGGCRHPVCRHGGYVLTRLTKRGRIDRRFGRRGHDRLRKLRFAPYDPPEDRGRRGGPTELGGNVARRADGTLLVAGVWGYDFTVARRRPGGGPDRSFAGDGYRSVPLGLNSQAYAVVSQPDGKIVAAGHRDRTAFSGSDIVVVRMHPDGRLDRSFGDSGVRVVDIGREETARDLALAPDGGVVVAATSIDAAPGQVVLVRLTAGGDLDPRFDGNGLRGLAFEGAEVDPAAVGVTRTGAIAVGGTYVGPDGRFEMFAFRVLPDGRDDPSFMGGAASLPMRDAGVADMVVNPDGRLTLTGPAYVKEPFPLALVRLTPTGRRDPAFGGDGRVLLKPRRRHAQDEAVAIAPAPGGKLVLAGTSSKGFSNFGAAFRVSGG